MMPGAGPVPASSQSSPAPFCGVPGDTMQAMAQATWNQVGDMAAPGAQALGAPQPAPGAGGICPVGGAAAVGTQPQLGAEQSSISLSAQAELELELSLRGSLLVQQQRRIVQLEDELQRAWAEIDRLRTKVAAVERERQRSEDDSQKQPRYWTPEEHRLFMEAVQRFGWKDVKSIAQHVGTRTPTQVRTHAQKLFLRQQKEQTGVMQPIKNGRSDMPALTSNLSASSADHNFSPMSATAEEVAASSNGGQMATGYLAQLTDAAEGMASAPAPAPVPAVIANATAPTVPAMPGVPAPPSASVAAAVAAAAASSAAAQVNQPRVEVLPSGLGGLGGLGGGAAS